MPAADVTLDDLDARHHEVLAELRRQAPVTWVDAIGGWVVTGRDTAVEVMRDPVRFTVDDPRFSTAQVVGPSMLSLDGTEHERHRSPFASAFRPSEVTRRYADGVPTVARRLVGELAPRGEAELRRELAGPLAVAVVARSLGLDDLDPVRLLAWYDAIVAGVADIALGRPAADDAWRAFGLLGEALDRAARRPDSVLLEAAASLTRDEVVSNAAVFLFGGIETSEGMTANLVHHVLARPGVAERIRRDRSLVDAAVEESLRLEPAAARVDRFATCDVVLGGARVRTGDFVVISLAAANRDPAVYDQPDEFRLDRGNGRTHVAFAQGPHACLGAQLARMEARAALDAVLDLLPGVELIEPPVTSGVIFRKPVSVHARWSPATA
ncbi:MAG: cytochrome P450 [Acidimicrobiales bacterium]